jgi:hypothetical protein
LSAEEENRSDQGADLSARLFLCALEVVGDPGAAEALLTEAAGRAFRWSRPAEEAATHRALLKSLVSVSHGPLNRCPRHPLPADLIPPGDEFDHEMESVLASLAGRERVALFLVLVEGYSYDECASVLGTTPANAGMLVYRARAALRARLVGAPALGGESTSTTQIPSTGQRLSRILRTDCRQAGAFISAEIDGQLGEKQRAVLTDHLSQCGLCGEERARLEQASAAVRGHWRLLLDLMISGGWTRRARRAAVRGSAPAIETVRVRRLRLALAASCLLIFLGAVATWAGLLRRPERAVVSVEGDCSARRGRYAAEGHARLGLYDGSFVELQPGAVLEARRAAGLPRPRLRLLSGEAGFQVTPGPADLVLHSAAGRVAAASGSFRARLIARDSRGRLLHMRSTTADSLAPGERLALAVESESNTLVLTGSTGPDVPVAPGSLAAVPVGEQPRPVGVPGAWVPLPPSGADPPDRRGGALARDAGSGLVVLFGGQLPGRSRKLLDDLWIIDPTLGGWSRLLPGELGTDPGARKGPPAWPAPQIPGGLLADPRGGTMWLYPGGGPPGSRDLWRLEVDDFSWESIDAGTSAEPAGTGRAGRKPPQPVPAPLGRSGAALAYSEKAGGVVLVGGEAGGRRQKDTWLFVTAGKTWKRLAATGSHPEARSGAVLAAADSGARLYLFGGRSAAGKALDDTWRLELEEGGAGKWTLLKPPRRPSARWGATMAAIEGRSRLVLFGGRPRFGGPRADTWVLTVAVGGRARWDALVSAQHPPAQEFPAQSMVWAPECRCLVLWCGGRVWSLRPKSRQAPG